MPGGNLAAPRRTAPEPTGPKPAALSRHRVDPREIKRDPREIHLTLEMGLAVDTAKGFPPRLG